MNIDVSSDRTCHKDDLDNMCNILQLKQLIYVIICNILITKRIFLQTRLIPLMSILLMLDVKTMIF